MADVLVCPRCSRQTPNAETCVRCGEPIPSYLRQDTVTCPSCLKRTPQRQETCIHCGSELPAYLRKEPSKDTPAAEQQPDHAPDAPLLAVEDAEPESDFIPSSIAETQRPAETTDVPLVPAKRPLPRAPDTTMKLLLRRNQKSGVIRRRVSFTLDARVELSPHMSSLVKKYQLGKEVLYQNFTVIDPGVGLLGYLSRWYFRHFRGAVSITVNDLVKGKHIECKDVVEMRTLEARLKEACGVFKGILESAAQFGGEEVIGI